MKEFIHDLIVYFIGVSLFEFIWLPGSLIFIVLLRISNNLSVMKWLLCLERLFHGAARIIFLGALANILGFFDTWYYQLLIAVLTHLYLVQFEYSKEYYFHTGRQKNADVERMFKTTDNLIYVLNMFTVMVLSFFLMFGVSNDVVFIGEGVYWFISLFENSLLFTFCSWGLLAAIIGTVVTAGRYRRIMKMAKEN